MGDVGKGVEKMHALLGDVVLLTASSGFEFLFCLHRLHECGQIS